MEVKVVHANEQHSKHADAICLLIEEAAKIRGTGIARREPAYIQTKIRNGNAVIALSGSEPVGFCYIETWSHGRYVVNSGLIVHPDYRKTGLARTIKEKIFNLSRTKYPNSKIFGITTSLAVMKINSDLGYKPVTFSELTDDESFWSGCGSCPNHDILQRTNRSHCLCTGMMYTPDKPRTTTKRDRWERFNRFLRLRKIRLSRKVQSGKKQKL